MKVGGTVNTRNMTLQCVSIKNDQELACWGGRVGDPVHAERSSSFLDSPEEGSFLLEEFSQR